MFKRMTGEIYLTSRPDKNDGMPVSGKKTIDEIVEKCVK